MVKVALEPPNDWVGVSSSVARKPSVGSSRLLVSSNFTESGRPIRL